MDRDGGRRTRSLVREVMEIERRERSREGQWAPCRRQEKMGAGGVGGVGGAEPNGESVTSRRREAVAEEEKEAAAAADMPHRKGDCAGTPLARVGYVWGTAVTPHGQGE